MLLRGAEGLSFNNPHPRQLAGPRFLHELIPHQGTSEGTPALDYSDKDGRQRTLSYDELHRLSGRLAARIARESPLEPARSPLVVPVMIPQSPELYLSLLAILKCGGAFCPLNLDTPSERIRFILGDVKASIVLTTRVLAPSLPQDGGVAWKVLCVEELDLDASSETNGVATNQRRSNEHHLAYGATLVCCDRTWLLTDLPGAIRQLDVDACELTPSVAGSLLKSRRHAPNLRLLLTIGEMLTQPVIEEFGGDDQNPSMLWGITLQPAFRKTYSTRCIGYPLETVSSFIIRITDETDSSEIFELLPIGEEGELAVGGHQLASEYINRPEQTAQAFIDTKYGRVYKTGDKALMRPDGSIECLGRVSEGQVKLNGQRMELGEIEHAILRTAGCHSAYVCVMKNLLVAFAAVVEEGRGDGSDIEGRIKTTCKTWLPAFMVPTEVVTMNSFPRLPSGKIDRKQMQKDYLEGRYTDIPEARQADTQNDLQRRICELVSHVLQSPVALSTNLMAAGLDSLVSIALAANLRDNGHPVNTLDVMRARTTLDLYNLLSDVVPNTTDNFTSPSDTNSFNRPDVDLSVLVNGNLKDVEGHYRCTELQKSMVSETLKDPRLYINTMDVAFPLDMIVWDRLKEDQVQIVEDFSPSPPLDTEQFLERPFRAEITADSSTLAAKARLFVHHALYDGWSFDLLLDDLTALAKGKSPTQRPQFHEIAQRLAPLPNGDHNSIITVHEFWADHLRGASSHSLPNFRTTACGNPEILSFCGEIPIDPVDVRQVSLETASSSQAIFHTGLVWLWSAITGSDDVTIGSVFSGRTLPVPGIEKVIGPLIQTLPVRTKLGQCRTIRDLVRSLHGTNQQILQLTPISLASIRKTAGLPQSCRLFDVLFVYQDSLSNRARGADSVREVEHKDYSEVKLLVEIEPRKDKFSYRWTWHTDCFSSSHIESFAKSLGHLVNYVVKHIDEPISSISTSFPHDMLSTYTPSNKVPLSTSNIVAAFESTAAGNFDHTALCFAHTIRTSSISTSLMTYKELDETANQVARYIHAQNIKTGGIVAIIMEKSPWLYCSILGILKAGCAYLPILPSTPSRRIQLILRQAQPQLCILDSLSTLGNENVGDFPSVIFDANILKQYSVSNLDIGIHPSQLAYIIYTSGTTGAPKGVSVTHQNLLSNIEVLSRIYPHDHTSSRMLQICSQAFDVSVFEIFFTWANGMCLCAGTNNTLFEDLELSIRQLEVTHLSMTVTVASLVDPVKVPGVSFLVTSGEPMTDEVAAKWCPKLYQGYGPSETTNICTVRKMSLGDSSQYLGGSFDNTPTFVLTVDSTAPVPIGCIGEFCFGGNQVAAGYLNMPELTASKFIDHPDYGRIYRSGDLGRMLPDGSLIILGRIDTQIKLRGQRIELQDVHANIMSSGLARSCASIVSKSEEDANKTQHLTSFYVPLHSMEDVQHFSILEMDDDALRAMNLSILQTLQAALPPYMLPTFLIPISQTPLTSSGKINTSALHDSVRCLTDGVLQKYTLGGGGEEWDTAGPEWTDLERTIASALAETLEIDPGQVSRWTSFLVIGLDSLTAMAFTRKLNKVLNQSRVTISEVLKHTSVARLSNFVSSRREPTAITETNSGKASLLPDDICADIKARLHDLLVESVLPCTPLQEAMLASSVSSSDRSTAYCNQLLFRLERAPDEIRRYWNEMCSRHGILRTCFVTTNNTDYPFLQVVLTSSSFALPWSYLETSADVVQSAREHIHTAFQRPVDSLKPPLGLAFIHDASSDVRHLSFVCHHALYDGVAMEQLLSEVEALAHGQTLLEPPIPFSYFLQETLTIPPGTESFWKTQFNAFVPQKLPSGLAAGIVLSETSVESRNNATIRLKAIETRAHEYGVPLSSICQAAWAMTLSAVLRTEDVCFGNVVSGRSVALEGVDRLVAPCFNAVPLRIDMSPLSSKTELLKRCRDANVDILPFQFTPLRKVQALLGGSPLFDTMVLLQPPSRALDNTVWSLEEERGDMDVPLICEFITAVDSDTLRVVIHHQENHVSDSMACLLRDIVLQALRSCMESQSSGLDLLVSMSPSVGSIVQGLRAAAQAEKRADDNNSAAPHTSSDEEEPMTGVQLTVRNIVARLGKINGVPITATTSLHRLGIDSIGMVQLVYLLRQEGLAISPVEVFENPTCAGIAPRCTKIVDTEEGKGGKPSAQLYDMASFQRRVGEKVLTVQGHSVARILPCTPVQQGMISQSIHSHGGTYINSVSWDLDFSVDMGSLEGAWKRVSERHDILRAGFLPISDPDASFAMVIKSAEGNAPTIEVLVHEAATAFDTISWRTRCRDEIMRDLLIPPWRLALVHQEESSNQMHLVMHHALYDASSLRRLLTDLAEVLLSEGSQNQTPMSGLSIESAIGTVFTGMASEKPDAERFWRSQATEAVINPFPTMTPLRVKDRATSSRSRQSSVPLQALRQQAAKAEVTLQAALQSTWARILSAYLGESSVTFGVVLDSRAREEGEGGRGALFPQITTLPVIANAVGESNREILGSMMAFNANLRRYLNTPLSQVQKWLKHAESPLFDTILVYQMEDQRLTSAGGPWQVRNEAATVDYPISLEIEETNAMDGPLHFNIVYRTDILPTPQAELILAQFDAILSDLLEYPEGSASELTSTAPDVFSIFPAHHAELPSPGVFLLHEFVERSAESTPDNIALEYVEELGNKESHLLVQRGVKPGDIVAVCFDKCPEAYLAILGILKTGAAFLALDTSAPASRLEFIVRDSGAVVLLHRRESESGIVEFLSTVSCIAVALAELSSYPSSAPELGRPITPSDTCYCLYTSGTTGTPKGCLISHDSTVQAMLAFQALFSGHWDQHSRWLQFASLHFDVSILEQYWSWSVGITVVAVPKDVVLSDLTRTMSELEITHIDLTPSLARLVHPDEVPSLCTGKNVFITGGEQLRQDILDVWGAKGVIYNAYGPTEATIGVTMYPRVPQNGRSTNIGRQFLNVGSFVFRPGTDIPVLKGADRDVLVSFVVHSDNSSEDQGHGSGPPELMVITDTESAKICAEARDTCRAKLPGYMVPTYFLCVPSIPLSANNKAQIGVLKQLFNDISLDQLRQLSSSAAGGEDGASSLVQSTEPQLAQVLARLAGVTAGQIRTSNTIYDLGFDSISVIGLARELQADAAYPAATPSIILQNPRLGTLCRQLRTPSPHPPLGSQIVRVKQMISACNHKNFGAVTEALGVSGDDIEYIAPCTPLQEGMLSRSGDGAYFNSFQLTLNAGTAIDRDDGSRGLQAHIQDRHQQWISSNKAAVRYPLEIDCIQSNGAHTLIVRIFHGVYDARSFDLILERVKAAYRQLEAAQIQGPSFLNVLPHGPLCDYTDTRSFWQRLFEDVEFQPFPRLGQGSKDESDATQTRCLDFGGLEKKRIELGVTQQTIVQAAWLYVLRQQRCPRWPTVGVVLSGRSLMLEGIENTIGPLFNTLPFRVQDASALDWPSLVRETHLFNTSVLPFVHTPLRQIQKWCSRGQPLFDTLFTFDREDASHAASTTPDEALWTEIDSSTKADYPLAFEAIVTAGQKLKITLVSQGRTVDSTALRQLLDQFEDAAKALTSQNQFPTRLGTLPAIYDPRRVPPQQSPPSHVVLPNKKPIDFAWTKDACALRDEVAALANLPPKDINEDTNLLQLGLDSIDVIKLVPRLRRVGISLTTNELMRQSSLRDIIERHASTNSTTRESDSEHQGVLNTHIAQLTRYLAENSTLVDLLPGVEVKSVLPTTPLQDSMVAEMIMSDFHRYFNHDVLELLPGTDMQELESALKLVISSSPILRTVFIEIPDPAIPMAYCQVVAKQTGPFFRTGVILEDEGQEEFQSVFETARSRASRAKGRSGLLQLTPVRVSPSGRQFVVLSIAHALYDGASLDMFHRDVQAAYRHHGVDNPHEQRPPYVPVLADILNSTTREAEIFWAGFLHGASSTMVPEKEKASSTAEDREAPEVTVHRKQILSTIEASKLKSFCRHNRITTQTLGQACWAVVLSSLTHSLDVTFGVVMSGRDTADAQELMFPTMNTVPVRVVLHGTAMEYLQYTWENLSRINHFQHFPLRSAQRIVGKGPLFNTLFTMQQSRPRYHDESGAIWKSVHSASEVEYPVCIEMQLTDDGLVWRTAYSADHVAPEDGEQLLRQLDGVLAYFLDDHLDKDVVATDQITQQISLCGLPPFQNAMEDADGAVHHPSTNRLDSISLIKVSSVLRKRGMRANARALLKMTSIAEMAATIVQRDSTSMDGKIRYAALPADQVLNSIDVDAAMTLAGLGKEEVEKILPALPVQVHFLSQWQNTNGALFFWSFDMRLPAIRTTFNIEQAWTKLVKELPILRTRFAATGSSKIPFLQFVTRPAPHPTSASFPGSPTGEEYQSGCPLTYRSSPFVQLSVAKLRGAAGLDLTLKLHHALYDGFSLPIIMRKLESLCTQDATQTEIDVSKSSWDDFAKSHYVDGIVTEQKLFWSGYLEGMAARSHKRSSINGSVFPSSSSSSSSPARTRTSVFRPAALVGAHDLRTAASRGGVSPQALFLAAYARVLAVQESVVAPTETAAEKSPRKERDDMALEDVVFGVYLANRASFSNDLETAPCPTLSIVPLRVRFESQDEEIVSVASRIQKDLAEISRFENASVGLWEIEKWTQGGLKMDSFVNFLSLPKAEDKDKADIGGAVSKYKEETPPEPIVATEEGLATPSAAYMAKNAVRQTYMAVKKNLTSAQQDAIDVEATINGESLDIGVFASRERISALDAVLADLRHVGDEEA
ncbi:Hydroxamate-type ferrichrome siderophore peptide synthetase [Apiospora rasikravindrae]|uniref:Hydroxamate-type ferrichrome siderophore peptide synthetase n=1 Tax=Apiospora rasikravindrae TaxID=990691 RepID=A0ABR1TG86_9PEZI